MPTVVSRRLQALAVVLAHWQPCAYAACVAGAGVTMASRLVPLSVCMDTAARLSAALTLTNISMYTTALLHHVAGGQVGRRVAIRPLSPIVACSCFPYTLPCT